MKQIFILLCICLIALPACDDYVQNVDPLIDQVEDDRLTDPAQIPFLITGVQQRFATTASRMGMLAGGLSDELFFDSDLPQATFPSYLDIDRGQITLDNNTIDGLFFDVGELRFFSDDLIRRTNEIAELGDDLRKSALFNGNLYAGIARYYMAAYFGLNPTEGGGVINVGPFIPSSEMYDLAIENFQAALPNAPDEYSVRVVNSLIARAYLYKGDMASAANFAGKGMVDGDPPFHALYSVESSNRYWQQAGNGRIQWVVDFRFNDIVTNEPEEASRIKLRTAVGNSGATYYVQDMYPENNSPFPFMTWQENELILAETELNSGANSAALGRLNAVRASHGISPRAAADLDALISERERELFTTGARLVDQRRFNRFHLPAGSWQFFPITERERNINPNL